MINRKIMEKKRLFYMNRKAIPVLVFALIVCITSSAQKLKVNYENNMDSLSNFMLQYYRMQNVQSFHLTLKGDFNGKRAKIHKVTCNNGIFTECQLLEDYQHFILSDSIETLDFMAVPYGKDRIRIACFYPVSYNQKLFEDTLHIDKMKILMETYTAGGDSETPLMAYTTGIPFKGGTWFCGLRESGVEVAREARGAGGQVQDLGSGAAGCAVRELAGFVHSWKCVYSGTWDGFFGVGSVVAAQSEEEGESTAWKGCVL